MERSRTRASSAGGGFNHSSNYNRHIRKRVEKCRREDGVVVKGEGEGELKEVEIKLELQPEM